MLTPISAKEFRSDLAGVCKLVQGGQTLVLTTHGKRVVGLVSPEFGKIADTIDSCDDFSQIPGYNQVIAGVFRHYAHLVEQRGMSVKDALQGIGDDVNTILKGLSVAIERGVNLESR